MDKPISYRDLVVGLRELGLEASSKSLVHVYLPALGEVRGGVDSLMGALTAACGTVIMPAFTYQTLVVPAEGPPDNGLDYSQHNQYNAQAEMFWPDMPVHASQGPVAEALRRHPQARRSTHPVFSFVAVGQEAESIVTAHADGNIWGPLAWLYKQGGDVLLMGADHTANVALHMAEKMAGRKQFVRWSVDENRAYRLEGYPGCARGFNAIAPRLAWITQQAAIGPATVQRIPLREMVDTAVQMIQADPAALLCDDPTCVLCNAVRSAAS